LDVVQECVEPAAQLHFFQREPAMLSPAVPIVDDDIVGGRAAKPRPGVRLPVTRRGVLHAVMGYFTAELADAVSLSNFPSYPGCNWAVWIWPLRHTRVDVGDEIRVQVRRPGGSRAVRDATDWRLDCGVIRQRRT
jgi:hypothetical protein